MLCFRLLNEEEPAAPLAAAVDALRTGQAVDRVFDVDPTSFRQVPNAPFAYWVSDRVRQLFTELPAFEGNGQTIRVGLQTSDDFRFIRAAWETPLTESSHTKRGWFPLAKGGSYSPFYADLYLKVNWADSGKEIRHLNDPTGIKPSSRPQNTEFYFRPGLTWPSRTNGLSFRVLPAGSIFAHKGSSAFTVNNSSESLLKFLCVANSQPFGLLVSVQLARVELAQSFEVGLIQNTPVPLEESQDLTNIGSRAWAKKRTPDTANLTSHAFFSPSLSRGHTTLSVGVLAWSTLLNETSATLADFQQQIDDIAYRMYGIAAEDRRAIKEMLTSTSAVTEDANSTEPDEETDDTSSTADGPTLVAELLDYALGVVNGRWDVRYATGATPAPAEPDPFAALPVCAPGMLQNAAGLPAAPADVPDDYPLGITWSGILVDDERKSDDLVRRVHEVLEVIFPGRADAISDEACAILGTKSLRDWFRSPSGFFSGHLKRHSKSRRQAPIYWPLSSPKGLYTVWLYLHRLTTDTFFTVLRDHVNPRLEDEERHVFNLKQQAGPSVTPSQARDIAAAEELVEDLRALRDELQHIAPLWRPDLNDGVIINHAPLWRMANHAPWRKALKETWESLVAEKYDWAHLALHLWPERVIPKCAKDRSLAIAHGLEAIFWGTDPKTGEVVAIQRTEAEMKALITERTSPAVKAALDSLLTAAAPAGGTTKRGRKTKSS